MASFFTVLTVMCGHMFLCHMSYSAAATIGSIPMETQIALNQLMREDYEGLVRVAYPLVARPCVRERLKVNLTGRTKLYVDSTHFSKPTEIYLFYCGRHRLWQMDYMHGNGSLNCVRCMELSNDLSKTLNHRRLNNDIGC
jgi:hypothetical protein